MNKFSFQYFSYISFEWKWITLNGCVQSDPTIYSYKEINESNAIFGLFRKSVRVMVKNGNSWIVYDPNEFEEICWQKYGF